MLFSNFHHKNKEQWKETKVGRKELCNYTFASYGLFGHRESSTNICKQHTTTWTVNTGTRVIQSFDFLITCEGITLLWKRFFAGVFKNNRKQEGSVYDMRKLIGRKGGWGGGGIRVSIYSI